MLPFTASLAIATWKKRSESRVWLQPWGQDAQNPEPTGPEALNLKFQTILEPKFSQPLNPKPQNTLNPNS